MKFISKWSYACAKGLAEVLNEDHSKRFEYYFACQLIIGEIVKTTILFTISFILGIFLPTLLISISFVSLRMIAGGYHMDTQGKCLLVTLGLFIPSALILKYTYQNMNSLGINVFVSIICITGTYILGRYAPKDTPNKPITDSIKKRKLKLSSFVILFLWILISYILSILEFRLAAICLSSGVLLELFVVSQIGHKIFGLLDNSYIKNK